MNRKVICAVDTGDLSTAIRGVKRLAPYVGAFKVGHALTLPHGLGVLEELRDAGASRIFLDLKFHDTPNSVALAVREAAKHRVWMMTVHTAGGVAMMTAAAEEAGSYAEHERPLLMGVTVLTSIDEHFLNDHLKVQRTVGDQMVYMSRLAVDCGFDGVISSPREVEILRRELNHDGLIVVPGIRRDDQEIGGHHRIGSAAQAIADGADYLVIGRGLFDNPDPEEALTKYGLMDPAGT